MVRMCLVVVGALVLLAGCKKDLPPATEGAELYQTACSRCHGPGGEGGIVPPGVGGAPSRDLTSPKWQATVTDEELRQVIRDGRNAMPGFGRIFSLDKIDLIVKHIRSLRQAAP